MLDRADVPEQECLQLDVDQSAHLQVDGVPAPCTTRAPKNLPLPYNKVDPLAPPPRPAPPRTCSWMWRRIVSNG